MYYLKYFILFSMFGFFFESLVYKSFNSHMHSGVLYGPYTLVYGFGGILTLLINNKVNSLNINSVFKYILLFILFTLICTLIEHIIGNLIHLIFNFDQWNYTKHKYHFGKYVCLDYSLIWGILSLSIIKFLKPFFDNTLLLVSKNTTIFLCSIIIIDLIITLINKINIKI